MISKSEKKQYVMDENVRDVNIKEFLVVIWRRLWIVILMTVVATGVGYFLGDDKEIPIYETSTSIIIDSDDNYMNTLMVMIKDPIVMEKVREELDLEKSPESLAGQIEVTQLNESKVITIAVSDQDPKMAMDIANVTATEFKEEAGNILDFHDVQLLSAAKENNAPINVTNSNQTVMIAAVFGLIAGLGFIFLLDSLDDSIEKENQVEEILDVPVIGVISNMNTRKSSTKKSKHQKIKTLGSDEVGITK